MTAPTPEEIANARAVLARVDAVSKEAANAESREIVKNMTSAEFKEAMSIMRRGRTPTVEELKSIKARFSSRR